MEYILQAVSTNTIAAVLLISLILNYARKHHDKTKENKLFIAMLTVNLTQCVIETLTIVIDGQLFPGAILLAKILNSSLFGNNIIFALLWSLYADAKVGYDKVISKRFKIIRIFPAVLIAAGALVNIFCPVFFSINEQNVYERRWPIFIAFVMTYIYLLLGTVIICMYRKKMEKYNFLPVFTFLMPVFAASIIQILVPGISLLWAGAAIGLNSAYMSLLDESSVTDKLSGLFSRHYLNTYLATLPSRARDGKKILGLMLDIDSFKSINDRFGHLVGDDAIVNAAKIIRKSIVTDKIVFRFAGDEFVVIMPISDEDEIPKIVARIHNQAEHFNLNNEKPYNLHFSIGSALYTSGDTANSFIERMDSEMYIDKKRNKGI